MEFQKKKNLHPRIKIASMTGWTFVSYISPMAKGIAVIDTHWFVMERGNKFCGNNSVLEENFTCQGPPLV